jgi:phage gp29-like protein
MIEVNSSILDVNGVPIKKALLSKEIAGPSVTGVRSIISGHPASALTPVRLARILREAEQGNAIAYYDLAEQMEELDLHYMSVMGTRKRAVAQMPMSVEPADDSAQAKADAAFVEEWLDRDTLDTEIFDILDAIGKGVSFVEIIWDQGEQWLPSRMEWQQPSWFEFDHVDGKTPMLRSDAGQLEALEPFKFIHHVHKAKSGLPVRGGIARAVAWGWMFKNYAIKDWVSFLEAYGQPVRVGRYDVGASEADIRKLMMAVAQVGTDAAAVFPRTMEIEFVDAKAGTAPNELWRSMAEYIDDQVSKAVLGQTSSADAKASGIGSGQSDLHGNVRDDIARADAKLLAATLNRDLVRPMIMLNFPGRDKFPRIKIEKPDQVDVAAMVNSARELSALGVEIDAEEMREMSGLPAPKTSGAKLLMPPQAIATEQPAQSAQTDLSQNGPQEAKDDSAGGNAPKKQSTDILGPLKSKKTGVDDVPATASAAASIADKKYGDDNADTIDQATTEIIGAWDDMFAEMIDPVVTQIASAANLQEAQKMLAQRIGSMNMDDFVTLMQNAGFSAYIAGEVDVAKEQAGE